MALDASIYSRFAVPQKSVADFDREYEEVQGARQSREMNALKLLMAQRQEQDSMRVRGEQEGIRNALSQLGAGATDEGRVNALRGLGTQSAFGQADALEKSLLERKKTGATIGKDEAETAGKKLEQRIKAHEFHVQRLGAVASPQDAAAWAQEGLQAGVFTPEQYERGLMALQQVNNPQAFAEWRQRALQGGMSATQQLQAQHQAAVLAESVTNNKRVDERIRSEGAANRGVTMRGQNMTDARQRDLNTITKEDKEANRKQAANEKAVTKFSDTLQKEGIPEIESALAGAEGIFQRYTDPKTGKLKDMPGVGKLTNALPDWAVSSEGKDVRESMSAVSNIVLSARSGAAVTDQELRRLARELSNSVGAGPEDMQRAYKKFRTRFDQVKANAAAGVSDAVLNEYKDRGGVPINRGGKAETKASGVDALLEKYK